MSINQYPIKFPTLEELSMSTSSFSHLDGYEGTNRADRNMCQIEAKNDFQAMYVWLQEYHAKTTTFRLYQREAERLLLWSLFEKRKALSSLMRQDLEDYFLFLRHPAPREVWCAKRGGRGRKRGIAGWRPFEGSLSDNSIRTTIAVIHSLFSYLEEVRYLNYNPFRLIRKTFVPKRIHQEEQKLQLQARILELDEWEALQATLEAMPEEPPHAKDEKYRLRLIVAMLFLLGLRVSELVSHHWNAFRLIEGKWWFIVKGKGDKIAKVPVNQDLLTIVKEYRCHMCFEKEVPFGDESLPIIASWQGKTVTARYSANVIKSL